MAKKQYLVSYRYPDGQYGVSSVKANSKAAAKDAVMTRASHCSFEAVHTVKPS